MSAKNFWRMTQGKILEGVFAINKPTGISSAQVIRDLQFHFKPSKAFAPWIASETAKRAQEAPNQRRRRKQKALEVKIGHGGTLDPLATGVLIAGVGKGTKVLQTFLECTKTYETVVLFGASTDSYDRVGRILKRASYQHITKEMVEKALGPFRGKIMQLPPLYSALKMNGKPLYEYAREGKEIPREIQKRAVEVKELELLEWMEGGTHDHKWPSQEAGKAEKDVAEKVWQLEREAEVSKGDGAVEGNLEAKKRKLEENQDDLVSDRPPSKRRTSLSTQDATMSGGLQGPDSEAITEKPTGPPAVRIRMTVTSGFYVRSLCHDLGEVVGSQAMMAELVRTRQGQFELGKNVLEYSDLNKGEKVWGPKVENMLNAWPADGKPSDGPSTASLEAVLPTEERKVDGNEIKMEEAAGLLNVAEDAALVEETEVPPDAGSAVLKTEPATSS